MSVPDPSVPPVPPGNSSGEEDKEPRNGVSTDIKIRRSSSSLPDAAAPVTDPATPVTDAKPGVTDAAAPVTDAAARVVDGALPSDEVRAVMEAIQPKLEGKNDDERKALLADIKEELNRLKSADELNIGIRFIRLVKPEELGELSGVYKVLKEQIVKNKDLQKRKEIIDGVIKGVEALESGVDLKPSGVPAAAAAADSARPASDKGKSAAELIAGIEVKDGNGLTNEAREYYEFYSQQPLGDDYTLDQHKDHIINYILPQYFPLESTSGEISQKINEEYDALADDKARAEYIQKLYGAFAALPPKAVAVADIEDPEAVKVPLLTRRLESAGGALEGFKKGGGGGTVLKAFFGGPKGKPEVLTSLNSSTTGTVPTGPIPDKLWQKIGQAIERRTQAVDPNNKVTITPNQIHDVKPDIKLDRNPTGVVVSTNKNPPDIEALVADFKIVAQHTGKKECVITSVASVEDAAKLIEKLASNTPGPAIKPVIQNPQLLDQLRADSKFDAAMQEYDRLNGKPAAGPAAPAALPSSPAAPAITGGEEPARTETDEDNKPKRLGPPN